MPGWGVEDTALASRHTENPGKAWMVEGGEVGGFGGGQRKNPGHWLGGGRPVGWLLFLLGVHDLSPGCRVAGCCRVGLPGCQGVPGVCWVAAGCCRVPGLPGLLPGLLPGAAGSAAGCCWVIGRRGQGGRGAGGQAGGRTLSLPGALAVSGRTHPVCVHGASRDPSAAPIALPSAAPAARGRARGAVGVA